MKHASLFTGIGGFDLAAQWAGWENVFQVEIDTWCQRLLKQNFKNAKLYSDIRDFDGTDWRGSIDVLSGGFPCQPFSTAGKRLGKEDDRHLWPEMLRAIREIKPRWVVGENVRGLTNWNGGLVFDEVQVDLENEGYEVTPYLLPACAVNAPHRRDRIWFVAYRYEGATRPPGAGRSIEGNGGKNYAKPELWGKQAEQHLRRGEFLPDATHTSEARHKRSEQPGTSQQGNGQEQPPRPITELHKTGNWKHFPTQSPVCGGDDGVPYRVDRIKGLGNAVVPQLVLQIFEAINDYEENCN